MASVRIPDFFGPIARWVNYHISDSSVHGGATSLGSTVVTETSFGQASNAGTSASGSRVDHTHGTPTLAASSPLQVNGGTVSLPTRHKEQIISLGSGVQSMTP